MKMPWADLAGILVTKDDLRGSGWSEAKIKLHLGEPKGRHPSTHFRNPLGQPYWTGQQVLSAAVRGGFISAELKDWPYQVPVHGLRDCGSFIMAIINFLIIAFVVFMLVKMVNRVKEASVKKEAEAAAAPAGPSELDVLLEIRDALKK